jgi:hypothetical protein
MLSKLNRIVHAEDVYFTNLGHQYEFLSYGRCLPSDFAFYSPFLWWNSRKIDKRKRVEHERRMLDVSKFNVNDILL